MNLSDAQGAVLARGFDYLASDRLTLMLNTAKDEFEDLYEWPWLWTPLAGTTPLTIANFKLMLTVNSGGLELLGLDPRQVAQDGTDLGQAGTPAYWWLEGANVLHVWPGDGSPVAGAYLADSPPLANPTDTPLIPARYHGLWVDYAVCEAYKDSDNFVAAQALRADIGLRMLDVIGRYEVRNRQHSLLMSLRGFNGDD